MASQQATRNNSTDDFVSPTATLHTPHDTPTHRDRLLHPPPPPLPPHPEPILIDWNYPYDPENPFDWPQSRKYLGTLSAFFFTLITALSATAYSSAMDGAVQDLHTTAEVYLTGSLSYLLAISFVPMVLAPASEVFGRRPIYITASIAYALMQIPICLAPNIAAIIAGRCFQGMAASVGNSMVGGSVADTFNAQQRGPLMALFALFVYSGQALGPVISGIFAQSRLGWRWVFWWQLIASGINVITSILFLRETRGSVLLERRALKLTAETGKLHRARSDERAGWFVMARTSLIRPFVYLFTEPVVMAISIWVAFAWGCLFLLTESIPLVFDQYGFDQVQVGLVFLSLGVGGLLGYLSNFHQNKLVAAASKNANGKAAPECRLYWACGGGLLFPCGMFWYAWTGRPPINWFVPVLALTVLNAGIYPAYVASWSYLADAYERYSSSALAAQSFARNMLAAIFPLFADQLYKNLGYPQASTLLAAISTALALVPFALLRYGPLLRARSAVVMALEEEERESAVRQHGMKSIHLGQQHEMMDATPGVSNDSEKRV